MSVGSPTAGTWSSSQWRPDNEFETDTAFRSMIRKNCWISAGPKSRAARSTVAAEPLMAASGVRNSWLTISRNSARTRSSSRSGAMSCMVTTTEATAPFSAWR